MPAGLSNCEKQRLEGIRRNQQYWPLGLVSSDAAHSGLRKGEPKAKRKSDAPGSVGGQAAVVLCRLAGRPARAHEGSALVDHPSRSWQDISGEHEAARRRYEASWANDGQKVGGDRRAQRATRTLMRMAREPGFNRTRR